MKHLPPQTRLLATTAILAVLNLALSFQILASTNGSYGHTSRGSSKITLIIPETFALQPLETTAISVEPTSADRRRLCLRSSRSAGFRLRAEGTGRGGAFELTDPAGTIQGYGINLSAGGTQPHTKLLPGQLSPLLAASPSGCDNAPTLAFDHAGDHAGLIQTGTASLTVIPE